MPGITTVLIIWASVLTAQLSGDAKGSSEADRLRRLATEFETAQRASFEQARAARTGPNTPPPARVAFDPRSYARRALDLAQEARDEAVAVDAVVWVVRHAGRTPEHAEAIEQIEKRFLRSDRIAGACWPIATTKESGERLLSKIAVDNPSTGVRGQACLGLTFARRMLLRDVQRFKSTAAERRDEWIRAYGQEQVDRFEKLDPAVLVSEAEKWLDRMLRFFPAAVLNPEVSDFFPILSQDLGSAAERILRRAAQEHPDPTTRQEATCALLIQQLSLAEIVAETASHKAGGRPSRHLEDVPGGAGRVESVEPHLLALEIDRRLGTLADQLEIPPGPESQGLAGNGLNLYHLLMDLGSKQACHAGAERLLRKGAESHTDERIRALFRRSLALHLAGVADAVSGLRFAAGADLVYWEALLGPDRVKQLRGLDAAALKQEARTLAEQIAIETQEQRRPLDRSIETLLRADGEAAVGLVAPEIEGEDLDGKPFKLSDHRGRVVLLDFWNHRGCPPCREAYPKLRALAKEFDGRPFEILGVNTDDEQAELAQLVKDGVVTWRFWLTHGTKDKPTFLQWRIPGVPGVILLDHRGVVRARYTGTPSQETLEAAIKHLLEPAEKAG